MRVIVKSRYRRLAFQCVVPTRSEMNRKSHLNRDDTALIMKVTAGLEPSVSTIYENQLPVDDLSKCGT